MSSLYEYDSEKDSINDQKYDTSEDESDPSDEEDDNLEIFTITPRRCCSKGARRMLIIADATWYEDSYDPIVPRIMIVDRDGKQLPELTMELLNQPTNLGVE